MCNVNRIFGERQEKSALYRLQNAFKLLGATVIVREHLGQTRIAAQLKHCHLGQEVGKILFHVSQPFNILFFLSNII